MTVSYDLKNRVIELLNQNNNQLNRLHDRDSDRIKKLIADNNEMIQRIEMIFSEQIRNFFS